MDQNKATINGLIEGVSVIEKDNENKASYEFNIKEDLLYNEKETLKTTIPPSLEYIFEPHCEELSCCYEYKAEDFGSPITLTSAEETFQVASIDAAFENL